MSDEEGKSSWVRAGVDARMKAQQRQAEAELLVGDERIGPIPSGEWLRAHRQRVLDEEESKGAHTTDEILASVHEIAQRQVEAFAILPCRGSLDHIADCSDAFALTCERRESPSCPRRIREFDRSRVREDLRQRLAEADIEPADRELIMARDFTQDGANTVMRMLSSGVQVDAVLSVVCAFHMTKATASVDQFLADRTLRTLVLAGSVGVGKSVAAGYALCRNRGRYLACSQLEDLARFGDGMEAKKRSAFTAPLLVIDDVGTEKDWVLPLVQSLIVERHNENRRTVLTTNLAIREFAKRYGARVADRIQGSGMFSPLIGPSLRVRTA